MQRRKEAKRSLAGEIADAIQLGEFRPGEWLRQIDLQQKFHAPRFEVRAALDQLAVRQAVQHVPNRGYRVAVLDAAALADIRAVRVILECAAVPRIIARIDDAALARLRALARQFSRAVQAGTRAEQSRSNHAFHRLLYSLCGNPILEETIWALRDRSRGSTLTVWPSHAVIEQSDRDHAAMLDALERRAAGRLAEIVARHIVRDRKKPQGA